MKLMIWQVCGPGCWEVNQSQGLSLNCRVRGFILEPEAVCMFR